MRDGRTRYVRKLPLAVEYVACTSAADDADETVPSYSRLTAHSRQRETCDEVSEASEALWQGL